jgi:hypothetical protein
MQAIGETDDHLLAEGAGGALVVLVPGIGHHAKTLREHQRLETGNDPAGGKGGNSRVNQAQQRHSKAACSNSNSIKSQH